MRCAGSTVTLPRLGAVRTHESTRKLARRLGNGTARILSATVSRTAQWWFVSFTVEVDRAAGWHARPGSVIGIDLGVKTLLTGVDDGGNVVTADGPRALRTALRALRRGPPAAGPRKRESPQARRPAGPHPCPGGGRPRRRAAQGHHGPGPAL
jgi:putative transposase